jgi:hypothetical protein
MIHRPFPEISDMEQTAIPPLDLIARLNLWLSDVIALEISAAIASPRFHQLRGPIVEDMDYIINLFTWIASEIETFKDNEPLVGNRRTFYAALENIDEFSGTVSTSIDLINLMARILEQVPGVNQPRLVPKLAINQRPW